MTKEDNWMEKKHILIEESGFVGVLGVICFLFFGIMMGLGLRATEAAEGGGYTGVVILLAFSALGLYMVYVYFNHYLKLYPNGEAIYSSYIGKKRRFQYSDIVSIEHEYMKTRYGSYELRVIFKDKLGNRLSNVDSNMKNFEQVYEWIRYRNEIEELQGLMEHKIKICPTRIVIFGKVGRSVFGGLGLANIIMSGCFVYFANTKSNSFEDFNLSDMIFAWVIFLIFLVGGIYLIYYAVKGYKKDYIKQLEESKKYIKI